MKTQYVLKILLALFACPLLITILSVPITSMSNVAMLSGFGMNMDDQIIHMVLHDFTSFGPILFAILFIASTFSIVNAYFVSAFVNFRPFILYGVAVAFGVGLTLIGIVELTFKTQIIAGNRSIVGLMLHVLFAFAGGALYSFIINRKI